MKQLINQMLRARSFKFGIIKQMTNLSNLTVDVRYLDCADIHCCALKQLENVFLEVSYSLGSKVRNGATVYEWPP